VIRRRQGQAISIGGDIEIEVIEISRNRVKLGITASRAISVTRSEVICAANDNRKAATLPACIPTETLDTLRMLENSARPLKNRRHSADM
jgi:carbon storage regulator